MTYYGTFGQIHYHNGIVMKDFYVEIDAPTLEDAEGIMFGTFGNNWSQVYEEGNFNKEMFPSGRHSKLIYKP